MYYLQLLLNGLVAGSVYALFAVGLTMTYGIFRFINFAHGELIAWGAYGALLFSSPPFNLPLAWAAIPAVLLTICIGLTSEKLIYAPLRKKDRITLLIASIGLSFFLRSALQMVFGADLMTYGLEPSRGWELAGLSLTGVQAGMVLTALVFMAGLYYLLTQTLLGKSLRAVSDNLELAGIMGLPINKVSRVVWVLSCMFAAVGGLLLGLDTSLDPFMGLANLVKAFAAVLLGGAGSVWGALLGGLFIGLTENLSVAFVEPGYKDFVAFAVIFLMLLYRPQGIFARSVGVR